MRITELKKYGFKYQPINEHYVGNTWYNKKTDEQVLKFSKQSLVDMGMYYDDPQWELISNASKYGEESIEHCYTLQEVINCMDAKKIRKKKK